MAPEKVKIKEEMLSPYSAKNAKKFNIKTGNINKLAPDLMSKKNYIIHYRNLKYYISQGLMFKKVHRILEFKQSAWIKPYIDFDTQKTKKVTNEADKNHFKLSNNAVCDKTMGNMRKRIKIRIVKTQKDFLRPTYISYKFFGKRLVAIHEKKEQLTLNKTIYAGCTVY